MKLKRAYLSSLMLCGGMLGGHFVAHSWVAIESAVLREANAFYASTIDSAASALGYEKPNQDKRLTITEFAELEAMRAGLNPDLITAVIKAESNNNPSAKSHKGAIGLMQVMPANAEKCGLEINELWDERKNISCGIKFLKSALKTQKTIDLALKEYNGGPSCAESKCAESEKYAKKVLTYMATDIK